MPRLGSHLGPASDHESVDSSVSSWYSGVTYQENILRRDHSYNVFTDFTIPRVDNQTQYMAQDDLEVKENYLSRFKNRLAQPTTRSCQIPIPNYQFIKVETDSDMELLLSQLVRSAMYLTEFNMKDQCVKTPMSLYH